MKRVVARRLALALAASISAVGITVIGGGSASASIAFPNPPGLPPTVTMDALPTVQMNGVVWSQVVVGNTVYAGGSFTSARPAGSPAGTNETPRSDLLAFDITTGNLVSGFQPVLNGQVKSVAASPDGKRLFIAGDFTSVDGQVRSRIAAIDIPSGTLVPNWQPLASTSVNAVVATSTTVYFGGIFSKVNGVVRTGLAAVAASTGALTSWAPSATPYGIDAMTMTPDRTKVVVGGRFTQLNGAAAGAIGAVDASTGATVPWGASTLTTNGRTTSSGIFSLTADNNQVYGGAWVFHSGGNLEGTFAMNPSNGAVNWVNDCWGDTYGIAALSGVLYTTSHTHECSGAQLFGNLLPSHYYALAWSTTAGTVHNVVDGRGWDYSRYKTSALLQWTPVLVNGQYTGQDQAAWTVTGDSRYVVMAGEFVSVNGKAQQGITRFTYHSGAPNAFGPTGLGTMSAVVGRANGTSTVSVSGQSAFDPDDTYLTYNLIRDGNAAAPVAVTTLPTVGAWEVSQRPVVTLVDTTAALNSTHSYQVAVRDGGGSTVVSSPVSVIVRSPSAALPAATTLAVRGDSGNLVTVSAATGPVDTGQAVAASTSPDVATVGGHAIAAFQGADRLLRTWTVGGGVTETGQKMATGTSPAIVASGGGYVIAYRGSDGTLHLWSSATRTATATAITTKSDTSPDVAVQADGEILAAVQSSSQATLTQWSSRSGRSDLVRGGMGKAASPAVTAVAGGGFLIAYRDSKNTLAFWSTATKVTSGPHTAMLSGTNPGAAEAGDGSPLIAYQAANGTAALYADNATSSVNQPMAAGTSPGVMNTPAGALVTFQDSAGQLTTYDSVNGRIAVGQATAAGASPAAG